MIHHQPARAHGIEQALAVQRQVDVADVLEHADADHLVETPIARQVAIVHQLQRHLTGQALGRHPLAPQFQLLLAEGDAVHLNAELASGIARQSAPAAADIQQPLAGLEPQLAAQMAQLGLLRLFEILVAGFEIGAGVDHVAVQPELVERVGQVVVIGNGLGVGGLVVSLARRQRQIVLAQHAGDGVADADHLIDRTLQIDQALNIGGTEQIETRPRQLRHQLRIADHQGDGRGRSDIDVAAVPQAQAQRQLKVFQGRKQ